MKKLGKYFLVLWLCILCIPWGVHHFLGGGQKESSAPQEEGQQAGVDEGVTVKVYRTQSGQTVEMKLNDYLAAVVAAEMPASFEMEALKAQAVAARSYTVNRMNENSKNESLYQEHQGADVCDDYNHCKAFLSEEQLKDALGGSYAATMEKIRQAVGDTDGQVVTYDGEAICAVFHSTSAGQTESAQDVWGSDVPYLQSVESPGEEQAPGYETTTSFSVEEFKSRLTLAGTGITFEGQPKDYISHITRSQAGGVEDITICGVTVDGMKMREIFNLRSAHFDITVEGDQMNFRVKGYGHGVGMSQYGANYMAKQGKSYEEILTWYYTGTKIETMKTT